MLVIRVHIISMEYCLHSVEQMSRVATFVAEYKSEGVGVPEPSITFFEYENSAAEPGMINLLI